MLQIAALPHPADPNFIPLGATLGGLIGRTIALRCGYDADNIMHWTVEGSYLGTAVALCAYLAANALGTGR